MKRVVITILLGLCITAGCLVSEKASAVLITNWCTSTYQITGFTIQLSGWDTVAITTDTMPYITVVKYAKNLRTGIESNNMVSALSGDTIEFRIVWQNQGGASDTVTLTDYIPSLMTFVPGSVTDTEANCDTSANAVYDAGENKVFYITNSVNGITPGPAGNGVIRFRATVN